MDATSATIRRRIGAIRDLVLRRGGGESPAPAAGPRREVIVWIRGLGRTAGIVSAAGDRGAQIALAVDPRFGDETIGDADAVVEHTAPRGLYRQAGRVRFDPSGVSFTPSEKPELVQRRDYVRLPVDLMVTATFGAENTRLELHVMDLSASGLLLARAPDVPLAEGSAVWLSIPLDDGLPPLAPRGKVVRGAETGTRGVRFDYITDADQERLVRFVLRGQLRMRREGRGP